MLGGSIVPSYCSFCPVAKLSPEPVFWTVDEDDIFTFFL